MSDGFPPLRERRHFFPLSNHPIQRTACAPPSFISSSFRGGRKTEPGLAELAWPRCEELRRSNVIRLKKRKLRQQLCFAHARIKIAKQMLHREPLPANDRPAAEDGGVGRDAREERDGHNFSSTVATQNAQPD